MDGRQKVRTWNKTRRIGRLIRLYIRLCLLTTRKKKAAKPGPATEPKLTLKPDLAPMRTTQRPLQAKDSIHKQKPPQVRETPAVRPAILINKRQACLTSEASTMNAAAAAFTVPHKCLLYKRSPSAGSEGSVRISAPVSVTTMVCSN